MKRILDININNKEENEEIELRPKKIKEFIGQEDLINNISISINAAKSRKEVLEHVLIFGPSGLGKTTIAGIIANEMGSRMHYISAPALDNIRQLIFVLNDIREGDVLFIDEIHRIPRVFEELLYSAMEDYRITIPIDKDNDGRIITIPLPPFTLVGATTSAGNLSIPMRMRFGISYRIDYYSIEDLTKIVLRTSKALDFDISEDAARTIAERSRGTPRIANRLFKRVRDYTQVKKEFEITIDSCLKCFKMLKIDNIGLDEIDIKYLLTIINRFNGGPAGVETIAAAIGEEIANIEEVYEPYLIRTGLIDKTKKGRITTEKAYKHLNIKLPEDTNKLNF